MRMHGILTHARALSSSGRAPHLHCGGEEFESPRVHFEYGYLPILNMQKR